MEATGSKQKLYKSTVSALELLASIFVWQNNASALDWCRIYSFCLSKFNVNRLLFLNLNLEVVIKN